MTLNDIIQILMGYLGTLGFNILFNLRGKKLWLASFGGLLSWAVVLLLDAWLPSETMRYFLGSAAGALYGEILARVEKTPTTTFLVPSVIPLIPGSALYYTMNYALNKQWQMFGQQAFYTLTLAGALAVGIIAVTTVFRLLTALVHKTHFLHH
jgi:uncharacterized membrane protein YjjB (DUF3815 family)